MFEHQPLLFVRVLANEPFTFVQRFACLRCTLKCEVLMHHWKVIILFLQVTTFADMSLAICHDGYLFGWGNSEYFQLGSITDDSQVHTPRRLPFNQVGKIVDAAAGGTICCLLNEHGEVWVWGYGILGKGPDLSDCKYPEPLPMTLFGQSAFSPDVKVKKVKCGMHHFAAINNKSELFTWGKNKAGSLGIAKLRNQYFPWKVLVPAPVIDVSCGVDHMIIIARSIV